MQTLNMKKTKKNKKWCLLCITLFKFQLGIYYMYIVHHEGPCSPILTYTSQNEIKY